MFVDWLAAGLDPTRATLFIQSQIAEHAELTLLLGMISPVGWLERVPTYKDQQQRLADRDLSNYGFLGYPVMQSADILIYRANMVPVGEDQVSHIELTREIARRFNHIYGQEPASRTRRRRRSRSSARRRRSATTSCARRSRRRATRRRWRRASAPRGHAEPVARRSRAAVRLAGGRAARDPAEPQPLLTEAPKVPGLDGQKMSKSTGNAIFLREEPAEVTRKIRTMQTDPARVRRSDPGNPEACPVWPLHKIYSSQDTRDWVWKGCTTAASAASSASSR
jgi:tryptophanyl-tRNA synthetase